MGFQNDRFWCILRSESEQMCCWFCIWLDCFCYIPDARKSVATVLPQGSDSTPSKALIWDSSSFSSTSRLYIITIGRNYSVCKHRRHHFHIPTQRAWQNCIGEVQIPHLFTFWLVQNWLSISCFWHPRMSYPEQFLCISKSHYTKGWSRCIASLSELRETPQMTAVPALDSKITVKRHWL